MQIIQLNDRNKLYAGIAAVALVTGAGGVLIGRSLADKPASAEQSTASSATEEPEETGPKDFVPMTAAGFAASGIATERVAEGALASEVIAQASVTAPPEGQALLTARADGAVVRLSKRLGDPVSVGETVALLESREATSFVADRNAAAARAQAAQAAAAREQRLFNAKITARQDLEAAIAARQTAQAELQRANAAIQAAGVTAGGRYLAVRSPISGRITKVVTQLGAYVSAGAELFTVSDPSRIQIEASVPVSDAQRVRPGDQAMVELPNGGLVEARVRSIGAALDAESRAATIVLQLNGAPGGLIQGQAVRVRIHPSLAQGSNAIVVPEEAVQSLEGRDVVFVRDARGFIARTVTTGERSAGRIEITSGLKPDETIATRKAFSLKAELAKGAGEDE